eukprot:1158643-Prorocentrum_minimum.AAC.1
MSEVRGFGNSTESVQYSFPPMRSMAFPPPFANIESDVHNRTVDLRPGDCSQDLGDRGCKSPRSESQNRNIGDST